ncbi:xylulokinase [Leptolyngbya ohadii]|uniref:xylulokinase n=1 Tax=Leptolyngbya ohadii TaxID=1962290 RepID=UPI000B599C69|nr:xylulokinase [Leptolyngbya ohadii]
MNDIALGLDLGTSGVRVVAVDLWGKVIAQATHSYPLLSPHPGWTEQDPAAWVAASLNALRDVAQQIEADRMIGLGLSGQMHGMVALDAEGRVIRPAILWNDQRTGEAVAHIESIVPRSTLIQRTGNPAVTGFQLPKIIWLRSEEPEAFARTQQVLLPKDHLGFVLTGDRFTEPSDASGTGCLHLQTRQWDGEILEALNLSVSLLPPVIGSTAIGGRLKPELAEKTGLPAGLPVIAGGGDNAAAAIGLGISSDHLQRGSISLGTSGVIFAPLHQPTPDPEGRIHLFCHADGGYHLLGVTLAAAGSLRWYRDTFAPQADYAELMTLAASSPAGARGVLFIPHLAGERSPYLDPGARGAWINLALAHGQPDLIRALLEGVALSLKAVQQVMAPLASIETLVATGGGTQSELWLQILANALQTKLVIPAAEEGAAYGAALLAIVGAGAVSLEDVLRQVKGNETAVEPDAEFAYEKQFQQFQALYELLKTVR